MTSTPTPAPTRRRRFAVIAAAVAAVAVVFAFVLVRQVRRSARDEELVIVEGIRKVCKLATIEVALADYSRRTVPKTIDLPFTHEPEAFLFYSGVVTAGFDVCDEPTRLDVDHSAHAVRLTLPPPRILSLDIKRFETINERSGFLNAISPTDRNRWYQEARDDLTKAALDQAILPRAETHARELLGDLISRWGYHLDLQIQSQSERSERVQAR